MRRRAVRRPKVLFICGSINQTTQLHQVARELGDTEQRFSPYFGDAFVEWLRRTGLSGSTIGGNKRRGWCLEYLARHGLRADVGGREGGYDLVVSCSDLVVPDVARGTRLVVVQEGLLDAFGRAARACTMLGLPRWFAGTALTGTSGLYDRMCVASEGWRDELVRRGASPSALVVTGIPNFDDCEGFRRNTFPLRGYVLVCTSDARETHQREDRDAFLRRAVAIAAGRPLVFKLHPNEDVERASREIRARAPTARVFARGSAEVMIANADAVVTRWSSTALVAYALGKELHSSVSAEELASLSPVQNGGASARNIARVCRELLSEDDGGAVVMPFRPLRLVPEVA
jgi:hypothetical protein